MIAAICQWIVRYTRSGGLDIRGRVKSSGKIFEDENEKEDKGGDYPSLEGVVGRAGICYFR